MKLFKFESPGNALFCSAENSDAARAQLLNTLESSREKIPYELFTLTEICELSEGEEAIISMHDDFSIKKSTFTVTVRQITDRG